MDQLDQMDAAHIEKVLLDVLLRLKVDIHKCQTHAYYDGAATMKGAYTGVAKRLLEHEPRALYFHCSAHNLNLCLQGVSKTFLL